MSTGNKILIVFGGIAVLIVLVMFIIYPLFKSDEAPVVVEEPVTQPLNIIPLQPDLPPVGPDEVFDPLNGEVLKQDDASARAEIERTTRLFTERFGSFSNFSNFANVTSLEGLMTPSMRAFAQTTVGEISNDLSADYYGVTTRLINLKITDFTPEASATVSVVVREEVQNGLTSPIETTHKDGRIDFVFADGIWLVDGLFYN